MLETRPRTSIRSWMPSASVVNSRCSTSSLGASSMCATLAAARIAGADDACDCRYCEWNTSNETSVGFNAATASSSTDLIVSETSLTDAAANEAYR